MSPDDEADETNISLTYDVVVKFAGPKPTPHELGVIRRAVPSLRNVPVSEMVGWNYTNGECRFERYYDPAEAEEIVRICHEGGLAARIE